MCSDNRRRVTPWFKGDIKTCSSRSASAARVCSSVKMRWAQVSRKGNPRGVLQAAGDPYGHLRTTRVIVVAFSTYVATRPRQHACRTMTSHGSPSPLDASNTSRDLLQRCAFQSKSMAGVRQSHVLRTGFHSALQATSQRREGRTKQRLSLQSNLSIPAVSKQQSSFLSTTTNRHC